MLKSLGTKIASLPWAQYRRTIGVGLKHLFLKGIIPFIKRLTPPTLVAGLVFFILSRSGISGTLIDNFLPTLPFEYAVLIIAVISFIPAISPLLGPSFVITLLIVIFAGERMGAKAASPIIVLPALFALDVQMGNKIIPKAFAMGETEPQTLNAGVPGVYFTRLITLPVAIAVAYVFSFVLF